MEKSNVIYPKELKNSKQETKFVGKVGIATVVIVGIGMFALGIVVGSTNS